MGKPVTESEVAKLNSTTVRLSEEDLRDYANALKAEGPLRLVFGNPNIVLNKTMGLIYKFRKKYKMNARIPVEVTEEGVFRYRINRPRENYTQTLISTKPH